jgi:predicted GNAT family acetyltransferase
VTDVRILVPGDEEALERFLRQHTDSSLFLRSNLRAAGLIDRGEPLQATYAAAWSRGTVVAAVAHCWNDNVLLQAPVEIADVTRLAVARSRRPVRGLLGPWEQVIAARGALGLDDVPATKSQREELFTLALDALVVPENLAAGRVSCRRSRAADLELLAQWRVAFAREALGEPDQPGQLEAARDDIGRAHREGRSWLLEDGGRAVATAAFNAQLPDTVQIGGVYTPPALRNRGYARAVVAGSLIETRRSGTERAVLFAENAAAKAAYVALGFKVVGEYGLILLRAPAPFRSATFPPPDASK